MPNGQPYCFPRVWRFSDVTTCYNMLQHVTNMLQHVTYMLQHVTTCYNRLFSWKCITIDIYWHLLTTCVCVTATPVAKPTQSPLRSSLAAVDESVESFLWYQMWGIREGHCDNNKIQQAQNDSDEIRTSQAGTGISGTSGTGLSHDLKPWSPWSPWSQDMRPNGATIVFHKACSSHWSYSICGHCEYYGYYIHLLIVVFFCIFLLPEFQTQNWLETHQSLLEVHCKTWRCNGETMKIFDHFDPFVPFDPFDHYNFDQFRSSKSSFWVSACVGAVASNSARGTRDARDAHLMGGCCWGVELHQRSSQILSDCRGFCDGKTVKHMMYMLKNW